MTTYTVTIGIVDNGSIYGTLRYGIENTTESTIEIDQNVEEIFIDSEIIINRDLTIKGLLSSNDERTLISSRNQTNNGSIFNINGNYNITFENVNFERESDDTVNIRAISYYNSNKKLVLLNCDFTKFNGITNLGSPQGVAIELFNSSKLDVSNCNFYDMISIYGCIAIIQDVPINDVGYNIDNCEFNNCGIYAYSDNSFLELNIDDSTFNNNDTQIYYAIYFISTNSNINLNSVKCNNFDFTIYLDNNSTINDLPNVKINDLTINYSEDETVNYTSNYGIIVRGNFNITVDKINCYNCNSAIHIREKEPIENVFPSLEIICSEGDTNSETFTGSVINNCSFEGIYIEGNYEVNIDNLSCEGSEYGLSITRFQNVNNTSPVSITNSFFTNCINTGIQMEYIDNTVSMENVHIDNCGERCLNIAYINECNVNKCTFEGTSFALSHVDINDTNISSCTFRNNERGISINSNDTCNINIINSLFYDNSDGLMLNVDNNYVSLINNTFTDNNQNGLFIGNNDNDNDNYELKILNCLIANNETDVFIIGGITGLFENNLISNANTVIQNMFSSPTNIVGTDTVPLVNINLGDITEYSDSYYSKTYVVPILPGSIAIGAGNVDYIPSDVEFDQRGSPYYRIINDSVDIGSYQLQENPVPCFTGDSIVLTRNIETKEISETRADHVYSGIHEVFDTSNKKFIPVRHNVVSKGPNRIMVIQPNAISQGKPKYKLEITDGHKILINGQEIKARRVKQAKRIKKKIDKIYTICTDEQVPIWINGLDVFTWKTSEWNRYARKRQTVWNENNPK